MRRTRRQRATTCGDHGSGAVSELKPRRGACAAEAAVAAACVSGRQSLIAKIAACRLGQGTPPRRSQSAACNPPTRATASLCRPGRRCKPSPRLPAGLRFRFLQRCSHRILGGQESCGSWSWRPRVLRQLVLRQLVLRTATAAKTCTGTPSWALLCGDLSWHVGYSVGDCVQPSRGASLCFCAWLWGCAGCTSSPPLSMDRRPRMQGAPGACAAGRCADS